MTNFFQIVLADLALFSFQKLSKIFKDSPSYQILQHIYMEH